MRSINYNVANKRSYKTVSITGAIVLAIAIVFLVLFIMSFSGYAMAYSEDSPIYSQLVYSRSGDLKNGNNLNYSNFMNLADFEDYSDISYSYVISCEKSYLESFVFEYQNSNAFNFGFSHIFTAGVGEQLLLETGEDFQIYDFPSNIKLTGIYLTFIEDTCFMLTYTTSSTGSGYENSLNNVAFYCDKKSSEYSLVGLSLYASQHSGSCSISDSTVIVKDTFSYRKDLPIPEKEGYTFTGWYYDEECTIPYQGEVITEDIKLYAGFKENVHYVTFYVDGEVWNVIKVADGTSLGYIISSLEIETKSIIGYENLNSLTVASSIEEFLIEDDVDVYLSDIEKSEVSNDSKNSFLSSWQTFCNNVKAFFKKIADWFNNLFDKIKR